MKKKIIWLLIGLMQLYNFDANANANANSSVNEVKDYTAIYRSDAYHINKNGEEIYSFENSPAKYQFKVLNEKQLLAIFEFERGNAVILLIDNSKSKVIDILELEQLESLSENDGNLVYGGENKFMFLEPGFPFWPLVFSISKNKFVKEKTNKFPSYVIKALKKTIEYVEHISDICEFNIDSCFYKAEYIKAVEQMRTLSNLLVL